MTKINSNTINKAIDILNANNVKSPYKYLYISKNSKNIIKYLDSRGYEKEIGDTIRYKIDRQVI